MTVILPTRRAMALGAAIAPFAVGSAFAQAADPLMEERRANLPKTLPWPVSLFQPQTPVPGVASPAPLHVAAAGQRTVSDAALAEALAYAQTTKSSALLVRHAGRLQQAWFAPGSGVDAINHTYHMQYTALVLLIGVAVAEGRIKSIDAPAADYLPEWRKDDRTKITLRNLLQMNAGLDLRFDATKAQGPAGRDARAYWGSHTKDVILNEYLPVHPPGEVFDYNYAVPEVLGAILERATKTPYQTYLSQKLWKPVGNRTAYLWLNRPGGEAHQDAGLFCSAADWLNVAAMMEAGGSANGRRVVPAAWLAEMRKPSGPNPNFGFMWLGSPFQAARRLATDPRVTYTVHAAEPFAADDVAYIDGYGGQRAYISPSKRLVIVRLGEVVREWDNSRLFNLVAKGLKA